VSILREQGRTKEAAEVTRKRLDLWQNNPGELYNGACELSLCIPVTPDVAEKQALSEEALAVLIAANTAGWSDWVHTARDPDLIPLHGRRDFQELVFDRLMPADAFAR
jgi:hypothetical protein